MKSDRIEISLTSKLWTKHPDGYYTSYFLSGYSVKKVQVYLPKVLLANGSKVNYAAAGGITCPANTGA